MKRVFLLGAGFSHAVSMRMPMMRALSEQVREDVAHLGLPPLPGQDSPVSADFERWLSYLVEAPPWLSEGDALRNGGAFADVAASVARCMRNAQLSAVSSVQPEWLPKLVRYWQQTAAAVITFNYDALVELSWLTQFAEGRKRSWLDLYPVPVTPAASRTGMVLGGGEVSPGVRLYKLHGSLNWYYSGPAGPTGDIVYDIGVDGEAWDPSGLRPRFSELNIADKVQLIVPPAAAKSPYYRNGTIRALWRLAADELSRATEVVLMGFSLPPSDQLVASMLATVCTRRITFVPVNPSHDVVERLRTLLESGLDNGYRVVDDYIRPNPVAAWISENAM